MRQHRLGDDQVVVTGGGDGTVRAWDLATRAPLGQPFTGHAGEVQALAVARPDADPVIVSAGDDSTLRLWDLAARTRS